MKKFVLILSVLFLGTLTISALADNVKIDSRLSYVVHSDGTAEIIRPSSYYSSYYGSGYISGIITIPEQIETKGKIYKVTSIGERAFYSCKSLVSVTLPNTLQSIEDKAFYECQSIKEIVIPDSVTFIGTEAFYGCSSLKTITMPFDASLAKDVFKYCSGLRSIIITSDTYHSPSSLRKKYSSAIRQEALLLGYRHIKIELAITNKSGNQPTINNNASAQNQSSAKNNSSVQNNSTVNNNNSSNQDDSEFSKQLRLAEQGSATAQNYVGWCYENGEGVAKSYSEACKWYKKSAEQGNSHAQNNVGRCYEYSMGVGQNYSEAFKWYKKSADQGYVYGQYNLGRSYENGRGVGQNYSEAFKWYMKAAEQGHSYAQNSVGYSYGVGRGVGKNYSEAFKWYMKAAEQGYDVAQNNVGIYYEYGYGVSQNYSEAYKWYMKSAEQGHARAQNNVGDCYYYGNGVEQDYKTAFQWYKKSADQGNMYGQNNVGQCYEHGKGVEQNYKEAFIWYMKAAEQGNATAQFYVGICYENGLGIEQNPAEAFKWYMKSAEQGNEFGQYSIGYCYENGIGISKDNSEAFKWYMKAGEQGHKYYQYVVGICYEKGQGVKQDYTEAFKWYNKSAEQGLSEAYNKLAYLYMEGNGVKKNERKAFEMIDKAIELSPDDTDYYDSKGELYSMLGDKEHALEMWNKIMSLDPKYAESKNTKFVTYIRRLQGGVDFDIPETNYNNNTTFAVIIANESYNREEDVSYALNDGEIFSEYCSKTLGIPEKNLHLIKNATLNDIRHEVNWVTNVMDAYSGDAKVIFYYAGHGIPDERTKAAYLLPVDGYGSDVATGYSLSDLYSTLGGVPSKSVIVFLDACFSGAKRDGTMLASSRGVAIKVNQENPIGNLIVFSASQGDETAFPYVEQGHGMFTYFILKKLQETKGDVTMGELSDYVTTQVKRESAVINNKPQTPTLIPAPNISTSWRHETMR